MKKVLIFAFLVICTTTGQGQDLSAIEQMLKSGEEDKALNQLQSNPQLNNYKYLNLLGQVQLQKGRTDLALENFEKASNVLGQSPEKSTLKMAEAYSSIAIAQWASGNGATALEYHLRAFDIRKAENDQPAIAASLNDIGLVYANREPNKAIEYYQKALDIYANSGDKEKMATGHVNLGFAFNKLDDQESALESLTEAMRLREEVFGKEHPSVAFVYANIGNVYSQLKEYPDAEKYLRMALNTYQKQYGEKHPEISTTYNLLGFLFSKQGMYDEAISNYQQAIIANTISFNNAHEYANPPINDYYSADILLTSMLSKANALETRHNNKTLKIKDLKTSFDLLVSCDSLIDDIRHLRISEADKVALGDIATDVYESAIFVSLNMADISWNKKPFREKAFYFAEKSKAAVLLESIADANAKSFAGIPESVLEEESELKADIAYFEQKLAGKPSAASETMYRTALFELNKKYISFTNNLEKDYAEYYALKYNNSLPTVNDLQNTLDENTALISYFVASDRKKIYVFEITKNKYLAESIDLNEQFERQLSGFRNSIFYMVQSMVGELGNKLYKQLFPIKIPSSINHLVIIPAGRIATVPFEALVTSIDEETSSNNYLVSKYSISYQYSASLFEASMKMTEHENSSISLFAPVSFQKAGLVDLPATENEVTAIQSLFDDYGITTNSFLKEAATKEAVLSDEITQSRFVHFATHGVVDEENPASSQISLAGSGEEAKLYSGDIYNLNLEADLVSLSACKTGLGKISRGEGIIGLSRSLIYAGANNLIVSLWSVSDASTSILMVEFYRNLLETNDYSGSLRKARLTLMGTSDYNAPYYWAPFILIGK